MTDATTLRAKHAARWLFQDRGNDLDRAAVEWFRDNGVDHETVTNLTGPVCRVPLMFCDDGEIVFDELGDQCFAFVVVGEDAETELDVVAFAIQEPEVFGTFLGQAGLCGTAAVLNPASFCNEPCHLWQTPLRWLQEGCQGGVVLDADLARPIMSRAPGKLICEDIEHARQLIDTGASDAHQLVVLKAEPTKRAA